MKCKCSEWDDRYDNPKECPWCGQKIIAAYEAGVKSNKGETNGK
jgi:hypothetical protein